MGTPDQLWFVYAHIGGRFTLAGLAASLRGARAAFADVAREEGIKLRYLSISGPVSSRRLRRLGRLHNAAQIAAEQDHENRRD